MQKKQSLFKNKKVVIGVVIALIIAGSVGGYFIYDNHRKSEIMNKMTLIFTDIKEVEYGIKDYDVKKELIKEVKDAKLIDVPELDTSKLGEVTLKFNLKMSDVTKEVEHKIKVVDTKAPEINLETDSKELTVGDTYDIKSNIKGVKDVIDGDLQEVEKKEDIKNGYYIEGSVDNKKAGEYKVKVVAVDKHDLKTEKDFTVNIKEKKVEKPIINSGTHSSQGNSSRGTIQDVINTAVAQKGKTYVAGGRGPDTFDCDGLIIYSFTQNGYPITSGKRAGYSIGTNLADAQAGDIIVTPNHVRLFLGGNDSAQAMNPIQGIRAGMDTQIMGYKMWRGGDPNYSSDPLQILDIRRVR